MKRAAVLLMLAELLACDSARSLIGLPTRKVKPGLTVPYPVGDPVPNSPVRAAFAHTAWVSINVKAPISITGHFVDAADNNVVHDVIRREVWGLKKAGREFEEIDPFELEAVRLMPPATRVWLLGTAGPCRATVGKPTVAAHATVDGVIEVRYELTGCPDDVWAPVGSLVESLPPDVLWLEAETVAEAELAPNEDWEHPFAPAAIWPDDSERAADAFTIVARGVRGLDPLPGQTIATAVWRHADDRCLDEERTAVAHLLLRSSGAEPQVPLPEVETVALLLGAVAQGDSPEALVYGDRLDHFVAIPPASQSDHPDLPPEIDRGPATWTTFALHSGPRSAQELTAAVYRVLPGCDP